MVHTLTNQAETQYKSSRIITLRNVLQTEQLNSEEQESLITICEQYADIFHYNYGKIAKPLTSSLKKDVEFKWSDLCQKAFEDLKNALTK